MSAPSGQPRPIEDQRWRRHHTGRTAAGVDFFDFEPRATSGCQRRRRKAIERQAFWNLRALDAIRGLSEAAYEAAAGMQAATDRMRVSLKGLSA